VGLYKFGLNFDILYGHNEKKLTNKIIKSCFLILKKLNLKSNLVIKIKKLNKSKLKRGSFTTILLQMETFFRLLAHRIQFLLVLS